MEKEQFEFSVDDSGEVVVVVQSKSDEKRMTMKEFEDYIKATRGKKPEQKKAHKELSDFNKKLKKGLEWNPKEN